MTTLAVMELACNSYNFSRGSCLCITSIDTNGSYSCPGERVCKGPKMVLMALMAMMTVIIVEATMASLITWTCLKGPES